jgi:hypothetical protein
MFSFFHLDEKTKVFSEIQAHIYYNHFELKLFLSSIYIDDK